MEILDPQSFDLLLKLLDNFRDYYHVEVDDKFNHLPTSLIELYGLGASPSRLQEYYDKHKAESQNKIPGTGTGVTKRFWRDSLGKKIFYQDYREFFCKRIGTFSQETSHIPLCWSTFQSFDI